MTLARRIKGSSDIASTRLVMCTANVENSDAGIWSESGIEAYLIKPVRLRDVRDTIEKLIAHAPAETFICSNCESETRQPEAQPEHDYRVLLVEDNSVNQEVARGMLEALGCKVEVAHNGEEGVKATITGNFDLVLMDLHMPLMDGFAASAEIRRLEQENAAGRRTPIAALTANVQADVREQCRAAGMDDYLGKPFTQEQLQSVLARWLPQGAIGHSASPSPKPAIKPAASRVTPGAEDCVIDQAALDNVRALQRPGAEDILDKLIRLYLDSSSETLNSVRDAVLQGEANTLREMAHSLKSASANMGALQLSSLCKELEELGRTGDTAAAAALIPGLEVEYGRVTDALRKEQERSSGAPARKAVNS